MDIKIILQTKPPELFFVYAMKTALTHANISQFGKIRLQIEVDAIGSAIQCHSSHQQYCDDEVREQGGEVHNLNTASQTT